MVIYTTGKEGRFSCDLESFYYQKKRTIFLSGSITDEISAEIVREIFYLADMGNDPITFYINSPGGSVNAGLAIYDAMKECGCDIITVCNGIAASMAAFLLAAGTPGMRYCAPNAEVMIHQVMGGAAGQAADIEICAEHIHRIKNNMNILLAKMTGQPVEKIRRDTDRDYFMNAAQAVEYGMVDWSGFGH